MKTFLFFLFSLVSCYAISQCTQTVTGSVAGNKLYVDASVAVSGDGSSWKKAVKELSDALRFANGCSSIDSILIAKGTYNPTQGTERDTTFAITRGGIKLYGGYPSGGGIRDIKMNPTVLSGNIQNKNDSLDNSWHVMIIVGLPQGADSVVVDGLAIKDGNGYNASDIFNFHGYYIGYYGTGIYITQNKNKGICFNNCYIAGNDSYLFGGVYNETSNSSFTNCVFASNKSLDGSGGAIAVLGLNGNATASFYNCVFCGNSAAGDGGAVYAADENNINIYNCTFVKNTAGAGAIISNTDGFDEVSGNTIANSILWDNKAPAILNIESSDDNIVSNCLIQGGYSNGENILTKAPRFLNINDLLGTDRVPGTADDGLQLQANSPAINAGDNAFATGIATDITGAARIANGIVDMGAYEYSGIPANSLTALEQTALQPVQGKRELAITLYPNPVVDVAVLALNNLGKNTTIALTDINGRILWKKEQVSDNTVRIPVTGLPSGTYLVTIQSDTFSKRLKLIKQ